MSMPETLLAVHRGNLPAGHAIVRRNLYPPAAWLEYASKPCRTDAFSYRLTAFRNHDTYCSNLSEKINEVSSLTIICSRNSAKRITCLPERPHIPAGNSQSISIPMIGQYVHPLRGKASSRFNLPSNPKSLTSMTQLWANLVLPCGVAVGPAKCSL